MSNVNKSSIGLVFQDKRGLHEFLTVEMEYFLPATPFCNIEWLRKIWTGKGKVGH
jgi:hypothetical protein